MIGDLPWLRRVEAGEALPDAAVIIEPPEVEHVGIAFRDEDGQLRWVHLAFHHDLRCEGVPAEHAWVASAIPGERLMSVAAMCERIVKRKAQKILYGFRYDATRFAKDGTLVLGSDEHGLTCATIILAVYRSVGIELLRREEWPPREDDVRRFVSLLRLLRKHCTDTTHLAAVEREDWGSRFRPVEVAAATSVAALPCSFLEAAEAAKKILDAFADNAP